MTSIARDVGKLVLVVVISVAILAGFNFAIDSLEEEPEEGAPPVLFEVVPAAASFEPVEGEGGEVLYYEARDPAGRPAGYGVITTFRGMWSDIEVAVGLDAEFRITGVEVLDQGETPGLGSRVEEESFESQFDGLSSDQVALVRSGGRVEAVSGATVTSRAVAEGIREAVEEVEGRAQEDGS